MNYPTFTTQAEAVAAAEQRTYVNSQYNPQFSHVKSAWLVLPGVDGTWCIAPPSDARKLQELGHDVRRYFNA